MQVIHTCREMSEFSTKARKAGQTIGFVPTMGALHEGHYSLMRRARAENDAVVASIFVNPTQFGPNEDLAKYPRTFDQDLAGCEKAGVSVVFAPTPAEMYPAGFDTYVTQDRLTGVMCGASRPGHFRGVLTVCCKLFNVVSPDVAYFGQKDYQQCQVIKRMVADLCMALRIEVCPTVREPDGLAMGSRNRYLSYAERFDAVCLYRALKLAEQLAADGETAVHAIIDAMEGVIREVPSATVDYITIADAESLQPLETLQGSAVAALAVKIGATRLIDNVLIGPPAIRR
ncbi:MAG TPA: pantoate--beta-alanine ligase [Planctomycetota bacterium]|nr:pantoate--beta-alanine ligase [Planctomycetota bacterium]